ncbi:MAG: single-stranded DNA-binding protein [Vallitalea sp.]|jgi:single-stranded DNA-binding protein|nr:single-stranded DNA-binding protein [Vallitalea sp.]
MEDNVIRNNQVNLIGKIHSDFEFSHEVYGEGFYNFSVEISRLSDNSDIIPILVSERLINTKEDMKGKLIDIQGQFRSYNRQIDGKNRLVLTVFAREISLLNEDEIKRNPNYIYLDGYICKSPMYRTTPFGREITDILLAVNRPYNKSDYIPCICWGRNARYAEKFNVGDRIKIWGRIQSREYQKKLSDTESISKVAYEVSISKIEVNEEE